LTYFLLEEAYGLLIHIEVVDAGCSQVPANFLGEGHDG
jgi:hypothetical protein